MKKLLFFYLLLISNSLFSQCLDPVSMGAPTLVDANCPGQGEITVNNVLPLLSGTDYYQYSLYSISNSSEVFTWQNSNIFPNLQAGSYEIRVRTRCSSSPFFSANYITNSVTLNNTEINTSISSVTVLRKSKCNNGVVSAVALGSGPLEYALVSSLTELEPIATYVRPRQSVSRFDSLPPGSYFMRVYNACDNASTIPFTIGVDNSNTQITRLNGYFIPIGCDSVSFAYRVSNFFKNSVIFPGDSQVKSWIKWPSGVVDTINLPNQNVNILETPLVKDYTVRTSMANFDPAYNSLAVWPFNLSQASYTIEIGMRDNCGTIHTDNLTYLKTNTVKLMPEIVENSSANDCDLAAYRFYIHHTGAGGTATSQGFRSLDGFMISVDGGATWTNARNSSSYTNSVSNSDTDIRLFQRGMSHTVLVKYCDTIVSTTFTAPATQSFRADFYADQNACLGYGRVRVRKYNANGAKIGIRVLSVPAGQSAIPYFEITLNSANEYYPTQFSNLLPGSYQIEILDTIGVSCPLRRTQTIIVTAFNFDFNFVVNCNKNIEITSTKALGGTYSNFRVKIFNSLNVQVFGGPDGYAGNTTSSANIPGTSLASLPNGTYTIRVGRRLGNSTDNCSYVEKTWVKNSNNNLTLQNSIFVSGCDNGLGALGASANGGSSPFVYTLLDLSDNEIAPSVVGGNTYENLNTAEVYKLSVLDACGAVVNRLISSNSQFEIATPGYSTMPCVGDNIGLALPQFTNVTYAWMKDSVLIPSASNNILNLPNLQLSDSGTYQSILTIGGCEVVGSLYINPFNCGGPLAVELTSFYANCYPDGSVFIGWETASELNSLDFFLQASNDLVNWENVDVVPAKGNSSISTKYQTFDRSPQDGVRYYQLIERGMNGLEKRYPPISNSCESKSDSELNVFPNPTTNDFNIEYVTDHKSILQLQIIDPNGRLISTQIHQLEKGKNTLFISETLGAGVYFVKIAVNKKELKPIKLIVN